MVTAAKKVILLILFPIIYLTCVVLVGAPEVLAQNKVMATHTFPDIRIGEFQNKNFPGSVGNDHKVFLGSVGSDLWHGPTDARDEFWMITDRGPNGQIAVEGKNRRTFWCRNSIQQLLKSGSKIVRCVLFKPSRLWGSQANP